MAEPQVVVVTGASAGIGRATAVAFARRGARVALLARGEAGLDGACREVEAAGGRALPLIVDVADAEAVQAAAARVEAELGPIDIWVNNAMATVFSPIEKITPDEFRRVTEVTYLGSVYGAMAALQYMRRRNRGTLVQVGSALAYRGIPLQAAYCGAKFAIRGFLDSLRSELIHDGIDLHVTMVQLGAFNTPQFEWARSHCDRHPQPVPPIYQPELAAEAIVWAATHRRREVTVGWSALKTILGNKLMPGLLDRLAASRAWEGQFLDEPVGPDRPDNLEHPVGRDFGAHGRFDRRARRRSAQLWLTTHRHLALTAAAAVAGLLLARGGGR